MPAKTRSNKTNAPQAMLDHKTPNQIRGEAKLNLDKKRTVQRDKKKAAVQHSCPICAWETAAVARPRKRPARTTERSH